MNMIGVGAGVGGASSPKPMVVDIMGDVGVVIENSLRRLMRSSRAKVGVVFDRSLKYPVLSSQLYQSQMPEVNRGVLDAFENVLPMLFNTDHCLKYVDRYRRGPE